MHIMIVNFGLKDLSEADYSRACEEQFAGAFQAVPGLVSKIWLRNAETNTYGGVYVWESREAMLAFQNSELARMVLTNPHFSNATITDFGILEAPTRATNGMLAAAA
jgi:hypothetical protein